MVSGYPADFRASLCGWLLLSKSLLVDDRVDSLLQTISGILLITVGGCELDLGSISNYHHLKKYELNSLTVGMYVWPEQENGDSI